VVNKSPTRKKGKKHSGSSRKTVFPARKDSGAAKIIKKENRLERGKRGRVVKGKRRTDGQGAEVKNGET